jgi:hypothetical protein
MPDSRLPVLVFVGDYYPLQSLLRLYIPRMAKIVVCNRIARSVKKLRC